MAAVFRPMSKAHRILGHRLAVDEHLAPRLAAVVLHADVVAGEDELDARLLDLLEERPGRLHLPLLGGAAAHGDLPGGQEGVGHRAAEQEHVEARDQALEQALLLGQAQTADGGDEGPGRSLEAAQHLQLLVHLQAGDARSRHERHHADVRGVGVVGPAEGLVDVHVAQARQRAGEVRVVGLLALAEAQVLEHDQLAVLLLGQQPADAVTDAVVGQAHVLVEQASQARRGRLERGLGIRTTPRIAAVGGDDDLGALGEELLERGNRGPDERVVADLAGVVGADVEVDPDEDTLAGDVDVADGSEHPASQGGA
ncbi:MAG: hypothetical protein QM765_12895 [Myxococcales bacterium]